MSQPKAWQVSADLDNAYEVRLRVRAHDPLSSVMAAEESLRFSGGQRERIMDALRHLGPSTAHDISLATGLTVVQVDRRLPEAKRDGTAEILQLNGEPCMRGKYRVWTAAKNLPANPTKKRAANK